MFNKLIIDANYNLKSKDGQLQVQISDGINNVAIQDDGSIRTEDLNQFSFLNNILKELQIMNLHLSIITDEHINKIEVD